jgi:hypothetical protein
MEPVHHDEELISAYRSEVETWRPARVPDLPLLVGRAARQWGRPVAFASTLGAAALAVVLVLSIVVVVVLPASLPGMTFIRDHLVTRPFP